jgi:kynurenine formamidase
VKLIDLTVVLDPANRAKLPAALASLASIVAPNIEYMHPTSEAGINTFCALLGCSRDDLPGGDGWGAEVMNDISSHCGTHVDAPLHSGSVCEGQPARTIDQIGLEELYRPAVVLDLRDVVSPCGAITPAMIDAALRRSHVADIDGHAVLLRTGQERFDFGDPGFYSYPGMTRESTLWLTTRGASILGTDALGWDRPLPTMAEAFRRTGDRAELWDGHRAVIEREAFIVQQLCNLAALPLSGFHIGCFPLRLAAASAAPARVVAFVNA